MVIKFFVQNHSHIKISDRKRFKRMDELFIHVWLQYVPFKLFHSFLPDLFFVFPGFHDANSVIYSNSNNIEINLHTV